MKKNLLKNVMIAGVISLVIYLLYVITLPAVNIHSVGTWILVVLGLGICEFINYVLEDENVFTKVFSWSFVGLIIIFVVGAICGIKGFNDEKIRGYMAPQITETSFEEAVPVEEDMNSIATLDTASARQLGKRAAAEETEGNQVRVSNNYSQIALNGKPMKVAPLEHNSFLKAISNADTGVSSYVTVDPVKNIAELHKLPEEEAMLYSPSSVFKYDLHRNIRRTMSRTALLGMDFFELNEEGKCFWITQKLETTTGLFGGKVIVGIYITNPHTGEVTEYSVEDVPEWVDIVFDGDYICEKFNDYGLFVHGTLNKLFWKKDCKSTTNDFGYKIIGNDMYIYTGITSVSNPSANVAFLLTNSRTLESYYIPVKGASEKSAMNAAQEEIKEKGYQASFPSLVNVSGEPTYLMVMKDENGLVKNVAMVNVKQYDVISVADTIQQAKNLYLKQLSKRDVISNGAVEDVKTVSTVINSIEYVVVDGATVVYIKTDKGVFKKEFEESLILLDDSDAVTISFYETGADVEYIEAVK